MTEHPIIFTGEMVRAILDGRKTQTRRVIKIGGSWCILQGAGDWIVRDIGGDVAWDHVIRCPYGVPGDRLWCREGFWQLHQPPADTPHKKARWVNKPGCVKYSDYDWGAHRPCEFGYRRRPSIHMPRWASRLTLEVTDVRVERVQEIQGYDITREGIGNGGGADDYAEDHAAFVRLWDSINKKRGYGWNKNPWVWVVTFKRVEDK